MDKAHVLETSPHGREAVGAKGIGKTLKMIDCPRNLTKDEMIAGLKAGRTLCVDRRDAPELPELLEMQAQGLVESHLVEIDEQSSVLKFRWKVQDE